MWTTPPQEPGVSSKGTVRLRLLKLSRLSVTSVRAGCPDQSRCGSRNDERPVTDLEEAKGCLEKIGEDDPEEQQIFRDLWEDETQWEMVTEKASGQTIW